MEDLRRTFKIFVQTNGDNKEVDYLLKGLKDSSVKNFIICKADNLDESLELLRGNGYRRACFECLLFDYHSFFEYRDSILPIIKNNRDSKVVPIAIIAVVEKNHCFPELDRLGIKIIPTPITRLLFRQRIEDLSEIGRCNRLD